MRRWAALFLLIYAGLCGLLFFAQTDLLFHPRPSSRAEWEAFIESANCVSLTVDRKDAVLRGFLRPGRGGAPAPTLLYFGGNAESVTGRRHTPIPEGWGLASFPYRGYGASDGSPSADAILRDAVSIYDAIAARPEVDAARIVTFGLSLGTGVAVHVARHRPVAGVVVLAPYDRLSSVGQGHYPWMPVSLLFRHEIAPVEHAPRIDAPLLGFHGERDDVIPIDRGRALKDAWKGPVLWRERAGRGHGDLEDRRFSRELAEFLARF